ncbi:lysine N(6)-hydroxylase/L-ornithine N(5)-oxygenase family protein [Alkanindiges illinoisensis]|uniref:lysine N(6)-hydroxylase/L-ornithine N(5)-oxygenase family protein n=1 Tax=Alkanindiges illinoisensis TaxID=197183 RepID=UPI00068517D8|nr:SidA/IucD/PvdA family monooxygenase [Alkanindiges illinoisensis]
MLDMIGIGLGPFNLSLAALLHPHHTQLDYCFFEQKAAFSWHDGMLLPGTTLQVPFMADLVSMVDPTSPFSFLNYLKQHGRLFKFYFLEKLHIPRQEYNHYCQWVSQQLSRIQYQSQVTAVYPVKDGFAVDVQQAGQCQTYHTRALVLGTGTVPGLPECLRAFSRDYPQYCFHSADFMQKGEQIQSGRVVVLGAGQSAAEVFQSLFARQLNAQGQAQYQIDWLTRASGFFPMEYSALGLEHFTPDYTRYFYQLPQALKDQLVPNQGLFYKGISFGTIAAIYEQLYHRTIAGQSQQVTLAGLSELVQASRQDNRFVLTFKQQQQQQYFEVIADYVISATGYQHRLPAFMQGLDEVLQRDKQGRLRISANYEVAHQAQGRIFVQNAELHTHGIGTPDLGLGAWRAATIINQLLEQPAYELVSDNTFQQFGAAYAPAG